MDKLRAQNWIALQLLAQDAASRRSAQLKSVARDGEERGARAVSIELHGIENHALSRAQVRF